MSVLSACKSVCHVHAVPMDTRKAARVPGIGVANCSSGRCWESNLGPLGEKNKRKQNKPVP